ncbi:dUTP diphosphatase [Candidatus Arthromitus sp. SFB-turkey]|uniref:dUTP diphosphatase n=1 Tax=Candidatus Arthromitus sp. SFB-turkey TaxID=1840217 RepID=UPI0007F415C5|nr:dUTP diphosphatase [Candidatus Arthromitus sp. SFB-turkey]OAT87570.1 deoxyuridine 5'-triphosphate nucleotidohydrolase [Candidatus Arthromitus sp. SFB-turkey]
MYELKIKLLYENSKLPEFANSGDAGMDIFSVDRKVIKSGESELIRTGISIELPKDTEIQIRPKSGLALNNGITLLNSPGTIDEGYRGEIKVIVINHGKNDFLVEEGMKIAQMVLKPIYKVKITKVDSIDYETDRGKNGFGSSGV